jgi:acyl-CoA dehydrogenase
MSTVGHPLSDVCNFMTNFYTAKHIGAAPYDASGFLPGATPGLPQPEQIVSWYRDAADWDPEPDLGWGMAFNIWRLAAVCQGIAARYAARQASSEKAKNHAVTRVPMAEFAWKLAQEASSEAVNAKL